MTEWAYFVVAWLPGGIAEPFPITSMVLSTSGKDRIYASLPMTQLDAMLMR
jgi:hypothetical protein